MTVFVKNKLVQDGRTTGYTINADGKESVYSVRDAVQLVHAAENANAIVVCNKGIKMRTNNSHIKAHLNNSHLRVKTGKLPIINSN